MERHVNGPLTPMSLGELRQALLAVVVGNPHFSDVEQLQLNHHAHESESAAELAASLQQARQLDAERGFLRRNELALALPQPSVCECAYTHQADMRDLLACAGLSPYEKESLARNMEVIGFTAGDRLRYLGWAWANLLQNLRKLPAPSIGFISALSHN